MTHYFVKIGDDARPVRFDTLGAARSFAQRFSAKEAWLSGVKVFYAPANEGRPEHCATFSGGVEMTRPQR